MPQPPSFPPQVLWLGYLPPFALCHLAEYSDRGKSRRDRQIMAGVRRSIRAYLSDAKSSARYYRRELKRIAAQHRTKDQAPV